MGKSDNEVTVKVYVEKIDKLITNDANPRKISRKAYESLKKSLKDFPEMKQLREIVVDENLTILGGHQRIYALKDLGYSDMAIKYGEGNATDSELDAAADAAYDATADAYDAYDADYATADAAAAYAAAAAAAAAYAAAADAAYDATADADARKQSQQATAEICRKYIPLDLILAAIKSQEKQKDGI